MMTRPAVGTRHLPASPQPGDARTPVALETRGPTERQTMSTFLWFLFAAIYLAALISLGLATLRKGHTFLFVIGIFFPLLWIVGALMAPTRRAATVA
jgi:hypothetical protein